MASSTSRSASAKQTSTRRTASQKDSGDAAKKSRPSPAKKSPSSRRQSTSDASSDGSGARGKTSARAESRPPARASQVAAHAAAELLELTGRAVEGVTGLERTEDGWTIQVEVVEVRRIPDTTDVLALYEVSTDEQGSLLGYRRLRRYARGVPGDD